MHCVNLERATATYTYLHIDGQPLAPLPLPLSLAKLRTMRDARREAPQKRSTRSSPIRVGAYGLACIMRSDVHVLAYTTHNCAIHTARDGFYERTGVPRPSGISPEIRPSIFLILVFLRPSLLLWSPVRAAHRTAGFS